MCARPKQRSSAWRAGKNHADLRCLSACRFFAVAQTGGLPCRPSLAIHTLCSADRGASGPVPEKPPADPVLAVAVRLCKIPDSICTSCFARSGSGAGQAAGFGGPRGFMGRTNSGAALRRKRFLATFWRPSSDFSHVRFQIRRAGPAGVVVAGILVRVDALLSALAAGLSDKAEFGNRKLWARKGTFTPRAIATSGLAIRRPGVYPRRRRSGPDRSFPARYSIAHRHRRESP